MISYYYFFFIRFSFVNANVRIPMFSVELFNDGLIVDQQKLFEPLKIVISMIGIGLQSHSVYSKFLLNVYIYLHQ